MPISPDMSEHLVRSVGVLYQEAEYALLERIAAALAKDLPAPDWAERKLAGIRALQAGARDVVDRLDRDAGPAIRQSIADAYAIGQRAAVDELGTLDLRHQPGVREDLPQAAAIDRLANAVMHNTQATHLGILRQSADMYRATVATVAARGLVGEADRRALTQLTLDRLSAKGITGFVDRAGRSWQLASYAEMAVRTAVARASIEAHTDRLSASGVNLVMVSDAPQECKLCRPWEGKVCSLDGSTGTVEVEHATRDGEMVAVTIVATLDQARAKGLMHPNCRHSVSAYLPGLTRPLTDTEDPDGDSDRQRLRYLERQVRAAKRREAAALDDKARTAARSRARAYQQQIREHVDRTGVKRRRDREQLMTPKPLRRGPDGTPEVPEPTPTPPGPSAPLAASARVSPQTRRRIEEAREQLPTGREGWYDERFVEVPGRRRLDVRMDEHQAELDGFLAQRAELVARVEAEFRRSRTPKHKRARILEERTADVDREISFREMWIEDLRRIDRTPAGELTDGDRRFLQLDPATEHDTYRRDPNGRLLPPETYERHLDRALDVGHALRDDLTDAFAADRELARLTDHVSDLRRADPVDTWALRTAQSAVARRQAQTIRALLADVRELGGSLSTTGATAADLARVPSWGARAAAPAGAQAWLDEALAFFPSDWLREQAAVPLRLIGSDRAFYGGQSPIGDALAMDGREIAYNGAFSSYPAEVAAHELGHRMEQYVPGLTELEYTYVRRRATHDGTLETPVEMASLYRNSAYQRGEITYRDEWANAYTGKTYERYGGSADPAALNSEVFQVGLQDLFGRSDRNFGGSELQAFMLGVLALL